MELTLAIEVRTVPFGPDVEAFMGQRLVELTPRERSSSGTMDETC